MLTVETQHRVNADQTAVVMDAQVQNKKQKNAASQNTLAGSFEHLNSRVSSTRAITRGQENFQYFSIYSH